MERWKIWMKYRDERGIVRGYGVHPQDYAHKQSAVRKARQLFWGDEPWVTWVVSQTNPFEDELKIQN